MTRLEEAARRCVDDLRRKRPFERRTADIYEGFTMGALWLAAELRKLAGNDSCYSGARLEEDIDALVGEVGK